ncbi:MAG: chemotaxis protein CheW [Leptospiraceae bacterium]|nr:chemotaxis protein CheW [Leptospiraceae bacterium]MCP5502134.1 chemotaxis protein CheW [Leptospiraceae bacterium]
MRTENHYSIFAKSDFYYCVSIEYVREVIKTNSLIITPAQTIGLVGFLDFRNSLCPVLDINAIIQNKKWEEKPIGPYSLMVLEYESTLFAVLIDRFVESLGTDGENGSSEFSFNNKNGQLLIDKTFRYKGMALNRISLEYVKSVILANIKSSGPQQDTINLKIETYEDSGDEIEMICFGIDHLRFGIPITDLVEVIEGYSVEPLFRIHPFLRGLINLRGQIIACVDISQVIGLPPP